ncbi:MAG: hypothetical protein Q4B28_02810 [bacterium]|nr:hypothetical protein [bacterium]
MMDHTMDEDQKVTHLNLLLNIKELSKRLPQDTHPLKKLATASGEYKIGNKTYILRDDQLISPSPSQS